MINRPHLVPMSMVNWGIFLIAIQPTPCAATTSSLAALPISLPATEYWDGNDGPWSSFRVQVGTPSQNLRLLPSNSGNAVWAVLPQGCLAGDSCNCGDLRGTLFMPNASSTSTNIGLYGLVLTEEVGLGYSGNANFGYDNLTLGELGEGLPTLNHQVIEGFVTKDFPIGSFGLSPHAVNISTLNNPQPSVLGALAQQNQTPSTSWAYTAGAYYRQPTAFGSLTLGGYDKTRFVQNNVTFQFGPDTSRDSIVPIRSITSDAASTHLLSNVIYAYIDSLVPHIWLPLKVCKAFEQAFGLTYNETAESYYVNDTLHERLVLLNPNVTFTLGLPGSNRSSTVDIVMHYGSFDLMADYPTVNNGTRYFPLKQAQNYSQYILGRAFLQDAYVIADYDRSNFSVSQAVFPNGSNTQHIVAIHRPGDIAPSPHRRALSTGAIVGIALAAVVCSSITIGTILRYRVRKKSKEHASKLYTKDKGADRAEAEPENGESETIRQSKSLEMPMAEPKELTADGARRPELAPQPEISVPELPEPTPELGGDSVPYAHQVRPPALS